MVPNNQIKIYGDDSVAMVTVPVVLHVAVVFPPVIFVLFLQTRVTFLICQTLLLLLPVMILIRAKCFEELLLVNY